MNQFFALDDKTQWPLGEWHTEPDKCHWYNNVSHSHRLMVRNYSGAWCGYASVPWYHPAYFFTYDFIDEFVNVHGGLSYSGWATSHIDRFIPHGHQIVNPAFFPVKLFGFDCSHYGDQCPGFANVSYIFTEGEYRNKDYVAMQVVTLGNELRGITWRLILKKIASTCLQMLKSKILQHWSTLCSNASRMSLKLRQHSSALKRRITS